MKKLISRDPVWQKEMGDAFLCEEGKKNAYMISKSYNTICLQLGASVQIIDFLRKRTYALPWNGHTVEEMQEWGWLKLKEE